MVAPLKQRGADELKSLQRRARRLYALERIRRDDFEYIIKRLNEVEARIQTMAEEDTNGGDVDPYG
jgi:hypothetical protein